MDEEEKRQPSEWNGDASRAPSERQEPDSREADVAETDESGAESARPSSTEPGSDESTEDRPAGAAAEAIEADTEAPPTGDTEPPAEREPGPDDLSVRLDQIEQRLARLEEAMAPLGNVPEASQRILEILQGRDNLDRARELAIKKMHEELSAYRQKGLEYTKKGTLENLLILYDNVEQCLEEVEGEARQSVEWLRDMLIETLCREDVEPLDNASETLDRELHKVVRSVGTDDPNLNRTIERVVKKGFRWHGELLRREHIVVRRYSGPETTAAEPAAASDDPAEAPKDTTEPQTQNG